MHFCVALLTASVLSAPWATLASPALALGVTGLGGLLYAAIVIRRARRQTDYKPVFEDWLFHTILPVVAYGSIVAGALALVTHAGGALFAIAAATLLLVFIGIHNAWDTVTWITHERRASANESGTALRLVRRRSRAAAEARGDGDDVTLRRRHVFVTGGTGYIGRALIDALLARGHTVRALVRSGGSARLPPGVEFIVGNALDASSYASEVAPADTLVQLVGTPHPGPGKTEEFRRVDLPSGLAAVDAALRAGCGTSCTSASRSRRR